MGSLSDPVKRGSSKVNPHKLEVGLKFKSWKYILFKIKNSSIVSITLQLILIFDFCLIEVFEILVLLQEVFIFFIC